MVLTVSLNSVLCICFYNTRVTLSTHFSQELGFLGFIVLKNREKLDKPLQVK